MSRSICNGIDLAGRLGLPIPQPACRIHCYEAYPVAIISLGALVLLIRRLGSGIQWCEMYAVPVIGLRAPLL